jgi:hypothetical protein
MDDFFTLSNRLLSRAPQVGIALSQQLVNDSWRTLQSRGMWSFRRRHGTFAPPNMYITGTASSNVATGNPNLITGSGTTWTPAMVGQQIRLGGLLYPYYTIVGYLSPTSLLIDQPWAGPDVTGVTYQVLQIYYPAPADFGYWYVVWSVKDAFQLWTNVTEEELSILDPQRTNQQQTYAVSFYDFSPNFGGTIGPVLGVTSATDPAPISTTTTGYSYVANATYIIQVVTGGVSGTATFQWMRAGQSTFTGPVTTSDQAQDLMDGVQIYWPDVVSYVSNDLFVINATSQMTSGVPRFELWPSPTSNTYLYPYIYIAKEYDLTPQQPQLPPFIANRGEVLLEMALAKAASYPGPDAEHKNPYFNLALYGQHMVTAEKMLWDLERNDQEVGIYNVDYKSLPFAPFETGEWMQKHAPYLRGG